MRAKVLTLSTVLLGQAACTESGPRTKAPSATETTLDADAHSLTDARALVRPPNEYCKEVCERASECAQTASRQVCRAACEERSLNDISKLEPMLFDSFYACVEEVSCESITAGGIAAQCLAEAVGSLAMTSEAEGFCDALRRVSDGCDLDNFEPSVCVETLRPFSKETLSKATECSVDGCAFILACLEHTLALPDEFDGTMIGFSDTEIGSGANAQTATARLFPTPSREAGAVTDSGAGGDDNRSGAERDARASDALADTATIDTVSSETDGSDTVSSETDGSDTSDALIDPSDPDLRAQVCDGAGAACETCVNEVCCDELIACAIDSSCVNFVDCWEACPDEDLECAGNCYSVAPPSAELYITYFYCSIAAETSECGAACVAADDAGDTGSPVDSCVVSSNECAACAYNACCAEFEPCYDDSQCWELELCVSECDTETCAQVCQTNSSAETVALWNPLDMCLQDSLESCPVCQ